jgi:HPt (histidine-containing phosphotransfer) domain-containing protein
MIPGLDIEKGIRNTGGNVKSYKKVLSTFYKDASERLSDMEQFSPLSENSENIHDMAWFTAQAHALKSAAGTIGADDIAELAAKLEKAGKENQNALIAELLPVFTENLRDICSGIQIIVTTNQKEDGAGSLAALKDREICALLKNALEKLDMAEIDRLIAEMGDDPLAEQVSELVLVGDYGKAVSLLQNYTSGAE